MFATQREDCCFSKRPKWEDTEETKADTWEHGNVTRDAERVLIIHECKKSHY